LIPGPSGRVSTNGENDVILDLNEPMEPMKEDQHDFERLKEFVGGTATLVLFTATHIHLAIRITKPNSQKQIYLLLDGCKRIEAPVIWRFTLPKLTTAPDGSVTIEDMSNEVRFVCEFFRVLDHYDLPFSSGTLRTKD